MTDLVFVDTNVWVYAVDAADARKRLRALEVVSPERGRELVISTQVLAESYAVVTRRLRVPLSAADAGAMVSDLARLAVVSTDTALVRSAIAGSHAWDISIWDAIIVRAAEVSGCRRLLTEDLSHGRSYGSVTAWDPFRQDP